MSKNFIIPITFIALTGSSLLDIVTTFIGLEHGLLEANPFLRSLPPNLFFPVMIALKLAVIGLSFLLLKKGKVVPVLVITFIMMIVVLNNLILLS